MTDYEGDTVTPRTKAGADLLDELQESPLDGARYAHHVVGMRLRAIEDEMLDTVAAAVEAATIYRYILPDDDETTPTRTHRPFDMVRRDAVLAALERIRRDDE